jgi:hypothetical protein
MWNSNRLSGARSSGFRPCEGRALTSEPPVDGCTGTDCGELPLSPHAATRMQQRGISAEVVGLLLSHGASQPSWEGSEILYFDHRARRRLRAQAPRLLRLSQECRDAYAVLTGDGRIATVGHRHKRVWRQ